METINWVKYLEDTRNDMAFYLLKPIESTLKNNSLSADEKNVIITKIVADLHKKMQEWDVKKYDIILP